MEVPVVCRFQTPTIHIQTNICLSPVILRVVYCFVHQLSSIITTSRSLTKRSMLDVVSPRKYACDLVSQWVYQELLTAAQMRGKVEPMCTCFTWKAQPPEEVSNFSSPMFDNTTKDNQQQERTLGTKQRKKSARKGGSRGTTRRNTKWETWWNMMKHESSIPNP